METNEKQLEVMVADQQTAAAAIAVTNDIELHKASEFLKAVKKAINDVEDFFAPMVEAAYKAHKEVCNKRGVFLKPLSDSEKMVKSRIGAYQLEQEERQREIALKAEQEARAREEREREKLFKKAEAAEASGDTEKAEALMEKADAVYVAPKVVAMPVSRPNGTSVRYVWDAEVLNKALVPDEFKTVDIQKLNRMATAMKGEFKVPGVRFIKRPVVSQKVG